MSSQKNKTKYQKKTNLATNEAERALAKRTLTVSSGPIPSPDTLHQYEKILPGLANRIVSMAENQSAHRIKIEADVIKGNEKARKIGQRNSFIITVLNILSGVVIAIYTNLIAGVVTILSGSIFISITFLR